IKRFIEYIPEYIRISLFCSEKKDTFMKSAGFEPVAIKYPALNDNDWRNDNAKEAINAFLATSLFDKEPNDINIYIAKLRETQEISANLEYFFNFLNTGFSSSENCQDTTAMCIEKLISKNGVSVNELYYITFHLWRWLRVSVFRETAAK